MPTEFEPYDSWKTVCAALITKIEGALETAGVDLEVVERIPRKPMQTTKQNLVIVNLARYLNLEQAVNADLRRHAIVEIAWRIETVNQQEEAAKTAKAKSGLFLIAGVLNQDSSLGGLLKKIKALGVTEAQTGKSVTAIQEYEIQF